MFSYVFMSVFVSVFVLVSVLLWLKLLNTCSASQKISDAMEKEEEGDGKPNYMSSFCNDDHTGIPITIIMIILV